MFGVLVGDDKNNNDIKTPIWSYFKTKFGVMVGDAFSNFVKL